MKRIIFYLMVLLLSIALIGCGTGGQDQEPDEGENNAGEQPNDDEENDEESEEELTGVDALLDQLTFDVDVQPGEDSVKFNMKLTHEGNEDLTLSFSSGQKFEIVVTDPNGEEVYRFSEGMMFTQAIETSELSPGDEMDFQDSWDYTKDGVRVDSGEYEATIELIPYELNGDEIQDHPFKEDVTFEVP
ncbi:BsuPI-related putative proteinase inhibitor [Alkalibacillus haloalkaliphilus]|uniref:Intracellular proteinase inhibitor BsuPI domain-containing protein n=1 Tax=Alkalibacillus haloalkaliphilus TaxID=94136 RepID=A0A511W4F6_9BACI|nr:BsuPI-related putative proteinase inhibitor [Alkalibacillus haloalkaliphilus]GEN45671.1 hypothetical protein AHA02nite_14470 [Alkalibacillus haloalkaliphilus]